MTVTSESDERPPGDPRGGRVDGPDGGPRQERDSRDLTPATLGVSAGAGLVHCVLVTADDHDRLTVDARVIDVDPGDRLNRADRVNSGIALMLDRARSLHLTVDAVGVAVRPDDDVIAARGSGPRREIHLVPEAEAVTLALVSDGTLAMFDEVIVVDCGDGGVTICRVDVGNCDVGAVTRSGTLSGAGVDAALADYVEMHATGVAHVRRPDLVRACRTAKEEVATGDSTTVSLPGGERYVLPATTVQSIVTPAVVAAVEAIADHRRRHGVSVDVPVALVGGLARMPSVRAAFAEASTVEVATAQRPELACAVGAALAVRPHQTTRRTAVFIGGSRHRDWLSSTPIALMGALFAAAVATVVAVSVAVDDTSASDTTTPTALTTATTTSSGAVVASSAPERAVDPPSPVVATSAPVTRPEDELPTPTTYRTPAYPNRDSRDGPARPWATTELTTPTESSVPTSTLAPETIPPSSSVTPSGSPSASVPGAGSASPTSDRSASDGSVPRLTPYPLVPTPPAP